MSADDTRAVDLDAARFEVAEDRRIAAIARQDHTKQTLTRRAEVTEGLIAEVERLRSDADFGMRAYRDVTQVLDDLMGTDWDGAEFGGLASDVHEAVTQARSERDEALSALAAVTALVASYQSLIGRMSPATDDDLMQEAGLNVLGEIQSALVPVSDTVADLLETKASSLESDGHASGFACAPESCGGTSYDPCGGAVLAPVSGAVANVPASGPIHIEQPVTADHPMVKVLDGVDGAVAVTESIKRWHAANPGEVERLNTAWSRPAQCPDCEGADPLLHPMAGGEVQPCRDTTGWHAPREWPSGQLIPVSGAVAKHEQEVRADDHHWKSVADQTREAAEALASKYQHDDDCNGNALNDDCDCLPRDLWDLVRIARDGALTETDSTPGVTA